MIEQRATLEKIAPTIEEAIASGLEELGLSEAEVEIEVLDQGSRGLLGIGGRQARVRLTVKSLETASRVQSAPSVQPGPASDERAGEEDDALEIARATVRELLENMHIRADVTAHFGEPDEPHYHPPILVDINGQDLSILIGRRAETLNSLQFVTRLIVGKELGRSVSVVVDVSGYRQRREQSLRQLAQRMARQAVKTGRRQMLEPMPANERRIIHIELRDNPEVTTESIGEEPRRKITISPLSH